MSLVQGISELQFRGDRGGLRWYVSLRLRSAGFLFFWGTGDGFYLGVLLALLVCGSGGVGVRAIGCA